LLYYATFLLAVLSIQLFTKKYIPVFYWRGHHQDNNARNEISDSLAEAYTWDILLASMILFSCLAFILLAAQIQNLNVYPIIDRNKIY
jgi:uncharacterized membrane-anchored protein